MLKQKQIVLSISLFIIKLFFLAVRTRNKQAPITDAHQPHISISTLQKAKTVNRNLGVIIY